MVDETANEEESFDQQESPGQEESFDEWLAAERARLQKGFTYEPKPTSAPSKPGTADEVLAGLGLGAGVAAGAAAPHPNPVTFEGGKAAVIVNALRNEIADNDTRVQVDRSGDSVVVTVQQSQENAPHQFLPALTVTLLEAQDILTVTVSDLTDSTVRGTLGSIGSTILDQGKRVILRGRRRGPAALLDLAGHVKDGVEDLVEDIQDLVLPRRVWAVIDRVGEAAEKTYLDEQRRKQKREWEQEEAKLAWTHCAWCGRAYGVDETDVTECPSCGAPRGPKPDSLK